VLKSDCIFNLSASELPLLLPKLEVQQAQLIFHVIGSSTDNSIFHLSMLAIVS